MSSEFDLIRKYFSVPARKAVLGVGDDCALIGCRPGVQLALSTDMLVEARHFARGADAEKLGAKALAVNLSDLAAAGADPAYALLALALPQADERWIGGFARGFFSMASAHGIELIGGDTTRGPLAICVTVLGEIPEGLALRRDGARAGDDVWLSGATGEAALALAHRAGRVALSPEHLETCLSRLDTPVPRVQLGRRLRGLAHAAIDVSDGLVADLGHIAAASDVGIELVAELLPRAAALRACADESLALECIAAGGDDYELAFTAPHERRQALQELACEAGVALTRIGAVVAGDRGRVMLRDASGQPVVLARGGFDHFQ